jgi:hypothetical protein
VREGKLSSVSGEAISFTVKRIKKVVSFVGIWARLRWGEARELSIVSVKEYNRKK